MSLPSGPLVAWLADDFTGGSAVAETLAFAGLPAALLLDPPDVAALAGLTHLRGVGLATTARTEGPAWMEERLPRLFAALIATGAPLVHYKVCSTMDSAPTLGSLGRALEQGLAATGAAVAPILFAAPAMGRFQAFGHLFAAADGGIHRIDRHPVMAHHPVTPVDEADVLRFLGRQTALPLAALMRPDLARGLRAEGGARGVAVDCAGSDDLVTVGRILWGSRFVLGSQGVEEALLAHWRAEGWLSEAPPRPAPSRVDRLAVVSGSASAITARQIRTVEGMGWPVIRLDAPALFGPGAAAAIDAAAAQASRVLAAGRSPVVATARGPDDPAVAATRSAALAAGLASHEAEAAIGEALGLVAAQLRAPRLLVAGGDTSGRVARHLGLAMLEPLAWIAHGASLMRGTRVHGPSIEIILKGGQMGPEDLFARALGATGGEEAARASHPSHDPATKQGERHASPHRAA